MSDRLPRLALATSAEHAQLHEDDLPLLAALREAGLDAVPVVWTDPSIDWSSYDAVLLRSIWDYHKRYLEFTEWLGQLDKAGVRLLNDSALVRWNADKRYLLELREKGVAIVPTQVAAGACLREVVGGLTGQEIVVKPTVSASATHTVRGIAGSAELAAELDKLPDGAYLVQPFQREVTADGEWSLLYFDGQFSHAVLKRAADGDFRIQQEFGGTSEAIEPPPAALEVAERTLASLDVRVPPVYARIDGIMAGGRFLLMEAELIEPYLFLPDHPAAYTRFADVVTTRLSA
ncbi:ATP-grasp domain-containing protein [Kribbella deserti]|uniref:RimK family alpha-L-glutamate ligase n=1 Tax=Kribbella deserti TaxID=1926257 RepID=A0ABV6QJW9_9ACTN